MGMQTPAYKQEAVHTLTKNSYRTWGVDLQMQAWVAYVEVMRRDFLVHGMLVEYEFDFAQGKFWMIKIW